MLMLMLMLMQTRADAEADADKLLLMTAALPRRVSAAPSLPAKAKAKPVLDELRVKRLRLASILQMP